MIWASVGGHNLDLITTANSTLMLTPLNGFPWTRTRSMWPKIDIGCLLLYPSGRDSDNMVTPFILKRQTATDRLTSPAIPHLPNIVGQITKYGDFLLFMDDSDSQQ